MHHQMPVLSSSSSSSTVSGGPERRREEVRCWWIKIKWKDNFFSPFLLFPLFVSPIDTPRNALSSLLILLIILFCKWWTREKDTRGEALVDKNKIEHNLSHLFIVPLICEHYRRTTKCRSFPPPPPLLVLDQR